MDITHLRHSCSHLLAASVLSLWPEALNAIGPATENGFYYDFDFQKPISQNDLELIEKQMKKIVRSWKKFTHRTVTREEAKKIFKNNPYKVELIQEIANKGVPITIYQSGNFVDLCEGGHCDNPSEQIKYFKLLSIAGAYWRGNEKNKMLTRIYGTCFATQKELEEYLHQLQEAKNRDHKKLGKDLDLFFFSDLVGPGLPIWTPKGTFIRNALDSYVWELRQKKGYEKVTIPHITKKDLYEKSGHWSKFSNELFKINSRENHLFAMKPMNCPHHIQIFNHLPRSYKEMPQRYAETTMVYRDEQTGELSGLSRVRSVTQDDAHVFCRFSQLEEEIESIWDIIDKFYSSFGFVLSVRLSLHDPQNMKCYLGSEAQWKKSESILKKITYKKNKNCKEALGEAAFYGPKIDFIAQDSIKRSWQVATIQLDTNMPEQFNLVCINEKGEEERIAMIHAAIMGSIERFMSILIEHTGGKFPLWLQPIQVYLAPVSDKHAETANTLALFISSTGIRTYVNRNKETVSKKIRSAILQKIPYTIIIGDIEMKQLRAKKDPADVMLKVRNNYLSNQVTFTSSALTKFLLQRIKEKSPSYES